MTSTSVVIPLYGYWEGCHRLLYDLYQNCSLIEEVIIVDNGNPQKHIQEGLAWWKSNKMLPIEVISLKENIGFTKASNIGLKTAVEDRAILISTDVRVHKDIIAQEIKGGELWGGRLIDWNSGWNFGNPYIEGWILDSWKASWAAAGYFDESYAPYDMEDVDLSKTYTWLGGSLHTYPEGYVSHEGAKSIGYNDERENTTKRNKEYFRKKWNL